MTVLKPHFSEALQEWMDVFMNRSMRNSMGFWKKTGMSMPQISTLMRLHYRGACNVSDLGSYLTVTPAAASQMIEKLVQHGYIERTEDPEDRRTKQITLTHKGTALVQKSLDARRRWLNDLIKNLSPEQQAEIAGALDRLTQAARQLDIETEEA